MADNILKRIFQPSARGRVWQIFILIVILTFIGGVVDAPQYYNKSAVWLENKTGGAISLPQKSDIPFHLGLDLIGGTHLVYEANMSEIPSGDQTSALEGVRDVIERRVNVFGVSEPIVQTSYSGGEPRVIVELAGISDVNQAITMIGETPLLEFKEQSTETRELTEQEKQQMDEINNEANNKAEEVLGKLLSGGDFTTLANEYNNTANGGQNPDLGWLTESSQNPALAYVRELEPGTYTEDIIELSNGLALFKLEDKRIKTNPFNNNEPEKEVKAAHLLICYDGIDGCDNGLSKDEAYAKIKEIKERATPANFAELAKEFSTGPSGPSGGDLGWFDRNQMVKPFADTVFTQELNTISYVVETEFGYHLIYKQEERNIEEFKVSEILIPTISEADIIGNQQDWKNTELSGKHLERAFVSFNQNDNQPQVSLKFDSEGSDIFADITGRNVQKPVAIFLDGFIISAPNVNEKITGGEAVISGGFDINEAKLLAQRLNAGALPVPIELLSQQTVGPSLGKASLEASLYAGMIGLVLVAIFMVLVYRLPGILAVFSLLIYGILVLALFKLWPVTLTLSGMAGFILSIGMAVDANVLIFERLREELSEGKPLDRAVLDAFDRAWPSIRDGNVSTLITCFILIQFTTSVVKGFAVTLGLGVLISMFSAIVITKTLLQLVSVSAIENKLWLVGGRKSS
jgi:protein-export membrane protein SecD